MESLSEIMDWIGYIGSAWIIISGVLIFISWYKGILTPVWRLGDGLAHRKITIFSKGDNSESFESLLFDTKLFSEKNVQTVTKEEDFGRCEDSTLYLVVWEDFGSQIQEILKRKKDKTALIVYAGQGQLQPNDWDILGKYRNVTVVNFKGRLLNDILVSLMVTGYEKD